MLEGSSLVPLPRLGERKMVGTTKCFPLLEILSHPNFYHLIVEIAGKNLPTSKIQASRQQYDVKALIHETIAKQHPPW